MATPARPLRFGLVGTGYWARTTHAPVLASTEGIELAAVWGRNPEAATALAAGHGAAAYSQLDAFLGDVDAVAFSVPPHVQSAIAVRAATAGKHLLLEKREGGGGAPGGLRHPAGRLTARRPDPGRPRGGGTARCHAASRPRQGA
jgi:hypothetical protein